MSSLKGLRPRIPGRVWAGLAVVVVYLGLGAFFEHETQVRGLLTPGGAPNLDVIATGGLYLLVRMGVRFGLPFALSMAVAGRAAGWLLGRMHARGQ